MSKHAGIALSVVSMAVAFVGAEHLLRDVLSGPVFAAFLGAITGLMLHLESEAK